MPRSRRGGSRTTGSIPNNSDLPLLVYRQGGHLSRRRPRNRLRDPLHRQRLAGRVAKQDLPLPPLSHSTAHEALGVYAGHRDGPLRGRGRRRPDGVRGRCRHHPRRGRPQGDRGERGPRQSSVRTRPGPVPTSAGEPRRNAPPASKRSRASRSRPAIPSTAPKALSASTGPEPASAPGPGPTAIANGLRAGGSRARLLGDLAHRDPAPLGVGEEWWRRSSAG